MTQKIRIPQLGLIICTIWILFVATASAQTIPRSQLGSAFEIRYGTVEHIDRVKVQSQAAQGAITGGLIGGATPATIIAANMRLRVRWRVLF